MLAAGFACLLLAACGSSAPPPVKPAPKPIAEEEAPEPRSTEWLYATRGVGSSTLKSECIHVARVIDDEAECAGEACQSGWRLGEDWLLRCPKAVPVSHGRVQQLTRQYRDRKGGARLPCMRPVDKILRDGCGGDPSCGDVAQVWATRCLAEAKSPLIARILEARLEQATPGSRKVKLDRQSCGDLSAALLSAARCAQRFQCQDALGSALAYRLRCVAGASPLGTNEGLGELLVRLGAGESPKPLGVQPDSPLDASRFAVPLADGSGVVALVCGQRPKDLESYLALREGCTDGEVVMVRRHTKRAKGDATLRIGRLPHPSDQAFARRYPSLEAQGEAAARTLAGLARLQADLRELTGRAAGHSEYDPEFGGLLIKALVRATPALRHASAAPPLAEQDGELTSLFKALAKSKRNAAKALKSLEHAGLIRRSLKRPLADVDDGGNVLPGAVNVAAALDLAALLPRASAAYEGELASFAEAIKKKALGPKQQEALQQQRAEALASCASSRAKVLANQGDLSECGFGLVCEPELLEDLNQELERALSTGALAHASAVLASDTLGESAPAICGVK